MKEEAPVNSSSFNHAPVLANEILESIKSLPDKLLKKGLLIDATLGGGGHASLILKEHPQLRMIGLDQDKDARDAATKFLAPFKERVEIIATNFANFETSEKVSIVLADLGVSSPQLNIPERGFSFQHDGPIDMRMNAQVGITAGELLETADEKELANIIYEYGEEKRSRKIARKIKNDLSKKGAYSGTSALAYAIAGCFPPKLRYGRIHPATKTFQALRIAVNQELDALEALLEKAPGWLLEEGLFIVISFHSLEDRRVKNSFLSDKRLERLTKKPIIASPNEVLSNSRSRSAKCRIARKLNSLKVEK